MTQAASGEYRDHRALDADELNDIIFSVLTKEYPKRVKRIVTYVRKRSDELKVVVGETQSLSGMILQRLKMLEEEKKVEWTPYGWKLR